LLVGAGGWVGTKPGFSRRTTPSETHPLTAAMQSADLLAGKEGTADPTKPIELVEDLAELDKLRDKGSSKTPLIYFYKKSMSKEFPKKSTKISMSVFPRLFCFISFSGVSQRWEFKSTTKNILQKNRQKIQNHFFSILFYHVFGRFSVRGVQKHHQKISKKTNLTLLLFWPLTHPPTTGVTICFWRPLAPPAPAPVPGGRWVGG